MPVSTRSKILGGDGEDDEQTQFSSYALRNPHHGLKEKLKALTQFYEHHKLSSVPARNPNPNPEVAVMSENQDPPPNSNAYSDFNANIGLPPHPKPPMRDDAKENMNIAGVNGGGLSCAKKQVNSGTAARKLSLGSQLDSRASQMQDPDPNQVARTIKNAIRVFVRLRPMMRKEKEVGARSCVKIVNRRDVYLTEFASENDYLRLKRLRGRHFTFDASFPESATQQEVYSATTAELVDAVLQGRNGSVFCYGATGAGKTYTMLGTVESPGVMVLAIKDLFTKIRQRSVDGNHLVHLSYLEVYNETVRDLLSPGRPLVLREDKQGIVAAGLTQCSACSTDEVMALLLQGNKNRTTEPTRANETSSRSHAILQVMFEYQTRDAFMNIVNRVGKLSLIDLAGSERALATDLRTLRSIEGANINRSLLALSSCINALVEGKRHIPYRNSKLTQLLKDSLGGACNTVMIANISPCNASFGETQNTLHWADRAKEIKNKVNDINEEVVPELDVDQAKLLLEVQKENCELRVQLAKQQQKLMTLQAQSLAANTSSPDPSNPSIMSPPLSSAKARKQRPKSSLGWNCVTPEPTKAVRELQQAVKTLEAEMERIKRDHMLELKKKDELIKELSRKALGSSNLQDGVKDETINPLVTRTSLRLKSKKIGNNIELRNPQSKKIGNNSELRNPQRFQSPGPATTKKRTIWDITTANSPPVTSLSRRKARSSLATEPIGPRSMLLQPGFARPKASPCRR